MPRRYDISRARDPHRSGYANGRGRCARRVGLAAVAVMLGLLGSQPVAAEALLNAVEGKAVIQEAEFDMQVEFVGVVAEVVTRQTFVNTGAAAAELRYRFDLPADAAVTALTIRLADGRTSTSAVVDAAAAISSVPDPEAIDAEPDLGLLRLIARDVPGIDGDDTRATATYELRVYPAVHDQPVTVTTEWVAPLAYDDGRLSLRVPGRGGGENLVRERVVLRLEPPPGVRGFAAVNGGGQGFGRVRRARFAAPPRGDLVIDASVDFAAGSLPVVGFSALPLTDELGAVALSVLSPPPRRDAMPSYERLLFIVDRSRSVGRAGLAAAAALIDAVLAQSPAETTVEAVLFDHGARRLFDGFRGNDGAARGALAQALRPERLANGSDLGVALEHAQAILQREAIADAPAAGLERGARASTLVIVLTDGLTPLELTPRRALDHFGADTLDDVHVAGVLLTPDDAPLPDTRAGVVASLAQRSGGRAIAARVGEISADAAQLAAALSRAAPLTELSVAIGGAASALEDIELPSALEAGQGLIRVGDYRGQRPSRLRLRLRDGGREVAVEARADRGLRQHAAALALARAIPEDLVPARDDISNPTARERGAARRSLVRVAPRVGVVTPHSSLVALSQRDRFSRDRLAMIRTWGASAFARLPPPPERGDDHAFAPFRRRVRPDRHAADTPARRTGTLDRGIVSRLLEAHVKPRARICYQDALRREPTLAGSMTIVLELARGEVQRAQVQESTFPGQEMEACVVRAAYDIQVPRVALGDDPESVSVVRYPLGFHKRARSAEIRALEQRDPAIRQLLNSDDPLEGLDE